MSLTREMFINFKNYDDNILTKSVTTLYLIALSILCYGHALDGTFVFDDRVAIVENLAVTQLPTNYTAIFYNDFWGTPLANNNSHKSYRPLTTLMFHYEYNFGWNMKRLNLGLHILNTVLLWRMLVRLEFGSYRRRLSLLTASLFAVHPVHVEAVSGIVSRADLMFALIYLISMMITINYYKTKYLCSLTVLLLSAVGVLFKETSVCIPLACIALEYTRRQWFKLTAIQQCKKLLNARSIIYIICMILLITWRFWLNNFQTPNFQQADNPIAHADSLKTRTLSQNYLYAKNIYILLDPSQLSFDWAFECIPLVKSIWDIRLLPVLTLYMFVFYAVTYHRKNFLVTFSLGLCVIPYLPAAGIFLQVGFVIAERVLYVPSMGFSFCVAIGYLKLLTVTQLRTLKNTFKISLAMLMIFHILRCRERAVEWLVEETLFTSALSVCRNNAKVHYNIARLAQNDAKNYSKAFYHYHEAIKLYPRYEAALMNLGNLYREIGNLNAAEKYLQKAIKIAPNFATAWMNLGIVQATARHQEKALVSYQTALFYRPNYANVFYNMGNMYVEGKQYDKALRFWKHAVLLKPQLAKAYQNILTALDALSRFEEALNVSEEALKLHRDNSAILLVRANVLGKLTRYEEAETLYKLIIAKEPFNYLCHTNLGVLYHRWNKLPLAMVQYRRAITSDPRKAITAKENLSKLISKLSNAGDN
uniref:dolichyl-phosphate-mannose--protein mannosyltransferase n=1 Tax=Glossina morsitans morsitans TaxID=37546 RepID=A0A1B0GGJ4_GLOMM